MGKIPPLIRVISALYMIFSRLNSPNFPLEGRNLSERIFSGFLRRVAPPGGALFVLGIDIAQLHAIVGKSVDKIPGAETGHGVFVPVRLMAGQPHRLAQVQPRQNLPQGLLRIVPAAGRDGAFGHPVFFHQPYPQTALRLFCRHSKTSFCFFSSKRPCPNRIPGTACAQCSASPSAATCSLKWKF